MVLFILVGGVYEPPKLEHLCSGFCPQGSRMAAHMVPPRRQSFFVIKGSKTTVQDVTVEWLQEFSGWGEEVYSYFGQELVNWLISGVVCSI